MAAAVPCKICQRAAPFFDVVDFNKCAGFYCFGPAGIPVHYHRCDTCGCLFTKFFDDWSDEEFRRFIYNADYRLVDPEYESVRPKGVAEHLAQYLTAYHDARILDYGAGGGRFAQRMAELGFPHVESYDPFSLPTKPSGRFDIITCTEVIEHTLQPLAAAEEMRNLLSDEGCIVLGETLQPPDIATIRANWWYVAPRNGHICTFADRTLATLAERLGLIFHRGVGHHVLRTPHAGSLLKMANRFGPAMACFRLYAPVEDPAPGFHGREGDAGFRFRWSATDTLTWHISVPPGPRRLIQVSIPYLHEARRDFARECRIEVAGRSISTSLREAAIIAEASDIEPRVTQVTLRTPPLILPPHDLRPLGLGVKADEAD